MDSSKKLSGKVLGWKKYIVTCNIYIIYNIFISNSDECLYCSSSSGPINIIHSPLICLIMNTDNIVIEEEHSSDSQLLFLNRTEMRELYKNFFFMKRRDKTWCICKLRAWLFHFSRCTLTKYSCMLANFCIYFLTFYRRFCLNLIEFNFVCDVQEESMSSIDFITRLTKVWENSLQSVGNSQGGYRARVGVFNVCPQCPSQHRQNYIQVSSKVCLAGQKCVRATQLRLYIGEV